LFFGNEEALFAKNLGHLSMRLTLLISTYRSGILSLAECTVRAANAIILKDYSLYREIVVFLVEAFGV
jgi:hypothetical protein